MIQIIKPFPVQIHTNVKVQYLDKFWVGASYRFTDILGGYAAMAGINISNAINFSYAYDVTTNSKLRTYTKNTHEFMLGFILGNKYGDSCPRSAW